MKICSAALKNSQVTPHGIVASCCYLKTEWLFIGSLLENSLEEIWNGEKNQHILNCLSHDDYSVCNSNSCPHLKDGKPRETLPYVEIDEFPKIPDSFGISYQYVCNYQCTCCMDRHNEITPKIEAEYNIIEKKLSKIMPHLKHITTNGYGEIMASKRILKLLANWRPLAPKEEVSVQLISNASLFDENHWRKIENLGQYNLNVQVSVMSFDEHVYQVLSGVKLPISRIENNLRFIKKLRDKGIVKHYTISSVVQDRNFRTMKEFTRRAIEEFGADDVRLQPIVFGSSSSFTSWIADVRGKYHPYHEEYVEFMKDPIFKHPKVLDHGAWKDSETGDLPQNILLQNEVTISNLEKNILSQMALNESVFDEMAHFVRMSGSEAIVYGANPLGITIALKLSQRCKIKCILDLQAHGNIAGIDVIALDNPNVHLIEWDLSAPGHEDWFYSDGIHLVEEGQEAYAELISEAIGAAAPEPTDVPQEPEITAETEVASEAPETEWTP